MPTDIPSHAVPRVLASVLLAGCAFLAPPVTASAAPLAACATGTPVAGDYDGDGAPDLEVTVRDNFVDDARFFFSPDRTNEGTWLDLSTEHVRAADLNSDTCADALAVTPGHELLLFLGGPSGLDPSTATTVSLPQRQQLSGDDHLVFDAVASTHDGLAQVVVAGRTWRNAERTWDRPFLDVFTLDGAGRPGTPQVLDAGAFLPSAASLAGWPSAMAADDGVVVVGNATDVVAGKAAAGSVRVFSRQPGEPSRLFLSATLSQATPGVPGTAEAGDRFGQAVALRDGRLAVGVPYETTGRVAQAGRVQLFARGTGGAAFAPLKAFDQNTAGVPGVNERKDRFGGVLTIVRGLTGTGSYDVVVGTPNEHLGRVRYAGSVTVGSFTRAAYRGFTQDSPGVPGKPDRAPSEALAEGDYFGGALGTLPTSPTTDTLVIGAPGETNGDCLTQGYVAISDGKRLTSSTRWRYLAPPTTGCSYDDGDVFDGWGKGFAIGSPYFVETP